MIKPRTHLPDIQSDGHTHRTKDASVSTGTKVHKKLSEKLTMDVNFTLAWRKPALSGTGTPHTESSGKADRHGCRPSVAHEKITRPHEKRLLRACDRSRHGTRFCPHNHAHPRLVARAARRQTHDNKMTGLVRGGMAFVPPSDGSECGNSQEPADFWRARGAASGRSVVSRPTHSTSSYGSPFVHQLPLCQ